MLTSKCRAKAAFATATAATIDDGALKTHFEEIARDWISLAAAAGEADLSAMRVGVSQIAR